MAGDDKPEKPFFPAPRDKRGYREIADRPHAVIVEPDEPKKIIATRPATDDEIPPDVRARSALQSPALRDAFRNERSYWDRYTFFASYPRLCGGVLVVLGALLSYGTIDTIMNGGHYFRKTVFFAPVMFFTGIFPLIFGLPRDEDQRTPDWWRAGYGASMALGIVVGVFCLFAIAR